MLTTLRNLLTFQTIPDYETRGPLPYTRAAASTVLISVVGGALLALGLHAAIGVAPAWVALAMLSLALVGWGVLRWIDNPHAGSSRHNAPHPSIADAIDLLQLLHEQAPVLLGIFELHDSDLLHVYDNPAACRFFGMVPGSTWGKLASELNLPDELSSLILSQAKESRVRRAPVRFEFERERGPSSRWFSMTICPLLEDRSSPTRFGYVAEEITELKKTEVSLLETQDRLASAIESGGLATWDWDIKNDLVHGDAVLFKLFGLPTYRSQALPLHEFISTIHADDRERVRAEIHTALDENKRFSSQYRVSAPSGHERWISATGRPIRDAAGTPLRFPGVAIDITHLKEVESALARATQSAEERLNEVESIYRYTPIGLCVFTADLRLKRINKVGAELFGRSPDDSLGHTIAELAPTIAKALEPILRQVVETKTPVLGFEVSGESPLTPGIIRIWSGSFYPLLAADGSVFGINAVTEDITEERRATQEHLAHRLILEQVARDTPLDEILNSLAEAVERIFPTAFCYIVRDHEKGDLVTPILRPSLPIIHEIFPENRTADATGVFAQVIGERREVLISDTSREPPSPFFTRLAKLDIHSCWVQPIILSNGFVWGACAIHHHHIPLSPTNSDREHLSVLLRLAATVIERKEFLVQLKSTTERLQFAETAGGIGVFDYDPASGKVVWTPQMEELFGLSPGSFEGTYESWTKRVHQNDLPMVEGVLRETIAHHATSFSYEYRFHHADGSRRWIYSQGAISYDQAGTPTRLIGVARDITERKRIEEESQINQERLNQALEAGALGIWDWHIPSGHVFFGGCFASMLGYAPDDLPPHVSSWERLVHPDDMPEVQRVLDVHLRGETSLYTCEHRLRKKDGSWLWILDRGRVIERDAHGDPIRAIGIHTDISEHHAIREALKIAAQRKDEFLATLAHELRNPLAPLRTGLQILKVNPSSEQALQAREMMDRQLTHMVRLIDDLLDVSRITRGQLELRRENVALRSVIDHAVEASMPSITSGGHSLTTTIPPEEIIINGDPTRLAQVISNLLVNAAKYTPANGSINLRAQVEAGTIAISVSDNGLGIPAEMLERVFEMFGQVNQTLDRAQGGLGIGLALVKKLVEMHGGEVRAESAGIGKGSTFTIRLPIVLPMIREPKTTQKADPMMTKNHMKEILVVDDNVDGAASLAMYLEMLGHKVAIAHDGREALAATQGAMPQIVFLDIGLPGMSGYEVARSIRAMPHGDEPLLVAVTGWGTEEDKRKSSEAGFNIHLTKPIDLAEAEKILTAP